ncbi:ABC transporter ATP-binding protein [Enterococcus cecorum]|uniref:ABC transporter ATP-binding protein n=1 Tax=Enterococcus cecorum TaxID=44008 RepID=UPI000A9ECE3F|nr:ABC transporter ATP-binding protein [Enterococcus cecorum]MCJ0534361.1 ABC transporter ATP-binding protein [Enterococcus cecorum]MCJ0554613.1 ABC transporter ATP-binding protein [Enterococcus cecorum]CAI3387928.1 ABC transporter ATP-binding protein [Enterococcus cecorum]CAI3398907.1 ABC transporter ATP-binding protein [Enterococcus cecorum]
MVLQVENLGYWYTNERPLFQQVNLTFEPRKMYAILGTSGSGKTTFLSLLAGLDQPKEGQITYQGESLKQIGLQNYRKNRVSIVFQAYNLLPYLSAVENVLTAMAISQTKKDNPKEYAYQQLEKVGLTRELTDKRVSHLSGGQQQRVAIVRAVCCGHDLIVDDEPTGNLDEQTSQEIIALFQQLAHEQEKCIILVTHEKEVANASDEVYVLKNQQLTKQADSL